MRQTEYVGLTMRAHRFVAGLAKVESSLKTEGMFEEEYSLGSWEANGFHLEKGSIIREVVQATPWSGGPMIFTCLEVECLNGQKIRFHQWVLDPTMKMKQYDATEGVMWI